MGAEFPGRACGASVTRRWWSCPIRRSGSAHLKAGKALGHPARGGQGAKVGRVERRVPLGEVDQAHPWVGRQTPHGCEEILHRHTARTSARSRRYLRAIDHVDVAIDENRFALAHLIERAL